MTNPTPEDIAQSWWDLCEQGRPVTVLTLAEALGVSEYVMRERLTRYGYLSLVAPEVSDAGR